jgi:hypothetical protein
MKIAQVNSRAIRNDPRFGHVLLAQYYLGTIGGKEAADFVAMRKARADRALELLQEAITEQVKVASRCKLHCRKRSPSRSR